MTRIYYATEFTRLAQNSQLISIGLVSEDGRTFYAESNEWDREKAVAKNPYLVENVVPYLAYDNALHFDNTDILQAFKIKECRLKIARKLQEWLIQFSSVEFWGDVQSYGWMHLCELFGGAREFAKLNPHVNYIPMDLATRLMEYGFDPDINRAEFAGLRSYHDLQKHISHNALHKAYLIRGCYDQTGHRARLMAAELDSIKTAVTNLRDTHAATQSDADFGWYEIGLYNGIETCLGIVEKRDPDLWRRDKLKEVTLDRKTLVALRHGMDELYHLFPNGSHNSAPYLIRMAERELQRLGLMPAIPVEVIDAVYLTQPLSMHADEPVVPDTEDKQVAETAATATETSADAAEQLSVRGSFNARD
jgi:hypothetical protein